MRIGTLPPADDRLYGPHAFAAGWLVLGVAVLLLAGVGLVWACWPSRRPRIATEPPARLTLRQAYLRRLDDLERQVATDELDERALHHELSRMLRRFAADLGTDGAASMSMTALHDAGQTDVAAAVRRFEHPQFEERPESDPAFALGTARTVISNATGTAVDRVEEQV